MYFGSFKHPALLYQINSDLHKVQILAEVYSDAIISP